MKCWFNSEILVFIKTLMCPVKKSLQLNDMGFFMVFTIKNTKIC